MDQTQGLILELIRNSFNPDGDNVCIDINDWPALFNYINEQGLNAVLYSLADKLPGGSKPPAEILEQWKDMIVFSAVKQIRRTEQMKGVLDTFNKLDLPVIVFKGPAIARFYENPECRSMSDLDIFVTEDYLLQTRKTIEDMGYELVVDEDAHPMHFGYLKYGHIYLELHYALLEPGILGWRDMDGWYRHIWHNRKEIDFEGIQMLIMAEEDELVNQVLHMATHMFHGGTKIRHIYDIALFINRCGSDLDWGYIEEAMRGIRLLKFGKLVLTTCHIFFGVDLPSSMMVVNGITPQHFMERFLNEYCANKAQGHQRVWQRLAWRMPFLCRNLFTLPIVYILEFGVQVKKHKRNLWESFSATCYNMRIFKDRVKTLQLLGMND